METVQIQCGSCGKVMAIAVKHLGSQVHCPHCQTIVQTPPRPGPGSSVPGIPAIGGDLGEMESIFAGPEVSEDLFDTGPGRPLVEMPSEAPSRQAGGSRAPASQPSPSQAPSSQAKNVDIDLSTVTEAFPAPSAQKMPLFSLDKAGKPSTPSWEDAPTELQDAPDSEVPPSAVAASAEEAPPSFAVRSPRRPESRGLFIPILLIFLIPYSILATVVIVYLLYNQGSPFDPLERLPDPKPKEGPRLQVAHDSPLPAKLKTRIDQPLRIGDIEIHPVKIRATREGDLVLHLKMRNLSSDMVFRPISDDFLKVNLASMSAARPYTYLDWGQKRMYGGFLEYGVLGEDKESTGDLVPGTEETLRIVTLPNYRKDVVKLLDAQETVVWRVQVRRGFIPVRGTPVSATAVVGVEFSTGGIENEGVKGKAL